MRVLMIGFAVFVCVACYGSSDSTVSQAGAPVTDSAAVRDSLEAKNARLAMAMTTGDTATMMAVYADDAVLMLADMPAARGREAIARLNAEMFAAYTVTNASFTTTDVIVTGDYAIETGAYRMTLKPRTGPAIPDTGKYISVWRRDSTGNWKMIRDISNSDLSQQ
jgi:uncharacterized protein (TIGR02246 family)